MAASLRSSKLLLEVADIFVSFVLVGPLLCQGTPRQSRGSVPSVGAAHLQVRFKFLASACVVPVKPSQSPGQMPVTVGAVTKIAQAWCPITFKLCFSQVKTHLRDA